MNKYHGLLEKIAGELHIECGEKESIENWKARIVYSLLGRMAYASLIDRLEEDEIAVESNEPVSITHFKRRICTILDSYLELYPEIGVLFLSEQKTLCDEIYDIILKSGYIYHTPYSITMAPPCSAIQGGLRFERGMPLDRKQYISGLGTYLPIGYNIFSKGTVYPTVQDMFGLQKVSLCEFWDELLSTANWHSLCTNEDIEYLPHRPPFYCWDNIPLKDIISIARIGQQDGRIYYLYQMKNGHPLGSQLPQWLVNDTFYNGVSYRIATNACLAAYSHLPAIQYNKDGPIVTVSFKYLLPPTELYWLKLYSWPQQFFHFPNDFTRIFNLQVFCEVKTVLEQIGYQFTEV